MGIFKTCGVNNGLQRLLKLKAQSADKQRMTKEEKQARVRETNKRRPASYWEWKREWGRVRYQKNRVAVLAKQREYKLANLEKVRAQKRDWNRAHSEELKPKNLAYYYANRERQAANYQKNREKRQIKAKAWRLANRVKVAAGKRDWSRERYRTNIEYHLTTKIRARIRMALRDCHRGPRSRIRSIDLLGCSYGELKIHIEALMSEGMNWDLVFSGAIELDHIKPCVAHDLTDPAQQRLCFHFSNLRPMWSSENRRKNSYVDGVRILRANRHAPRPLK